MPARGPNITHQATEALKAVGQAILLRRKAQRISAVSAAEAAGISRVTLHRIEKGEPSVTIGVYVAVCGVLGLELKVTPGEMADTVPTLPDRTGWIPARVRIADFPKLKELAWQIQGTSELTPREALGIYERNWRHLDPTTLPAHERDLVDALRQGLGNDPVV